MADGTPVMFKRKGAKPTQRSRPSGAKVATPIEVALDTAGSGEDSPSVIAAKLKNKLKSRIKPKTKLSFGADEDVRDRPHKRVSILIIIIRRATEKSFRSKSRTLAESLRWESSLAKGMISICSLVPWLMRIQQCYPVIS